MNGPKVGAEPTARRRQLGLRLAALRAVSGLTAEQAGERAGLSKATVSRYERAKGAVRWGHVDQLCRAYDASDHEREELVDLAKQSRVTDCWWLPHADELAESMRLLLAVEDEASRIAQHSLGVVPGLLQTEDYTRAIKAGPGERLSPEAMDRYVRMRARRQRILDRPSPPAYSVVLDEAVIRRRVGGPQVMAAQLDHLLDRSREPHVTIQVLPFASGAHAAALYSFVMYGGSDPALDTAFVETLVGRLLLEEEQATAYARAITFLRREALDTTSSARLIAEARDTHLRT
ncbi:helix-turn-helix domain-containing protein [Embleya sp. NPDC020630]|uniref:helix-turn-helix domain-containing protein n=1 Tax=Embleya sp. NPDC020630 TaxID=3363979 RepID=UPI00379D735D